jgi:hypothetical protein
MPNIAKLIAANLGKQTDLGFTTATLTRKTPGTRTPGNEAAGTNPTSATYSCKAMREPTGKFRDGTLVREGASLVLVLGGSLSVAPRPGDTIAIRGVTCRVTKVKSSPDPGGAAHECEVSE